MANFITGIKYHLKGAVFLLTHPSLWKYIILPLIFACFVFAGIAFGGVWLYQNKLPKSPEMLKSTLQIIALVFTGIIVFVVSLDILSSVFMEALSRKVEEIVYGNVVECTSNPITVFFKNIVEVIFSLPKMIFLFFLNFVPIIGQIITVYYTGANYLYYTLERHNGDNKYNKGLIRKNRGMVIGFGILCSLSLLLFPIYKPLNVVGGTLLAIEKIEKRTPK